VTCSIRVVEAYIDNKLWGEDPEFMIKQICLSIFICEFRDPIVASL